MGFHRHNFNLVATVIAVGLIGGFQIYSITVCNNLENIIEPWLNATYHQRYAKHLDKTQLNAFWGGITASLTLGAVVGSVMVSVVADIIGRRKGILGCGILTIVGASMGGLSKVAHSYEMIIVGRFMIGYSTGLGMGISSLYLTEIPVARLRGTCGAFVGIAFAMGDFLAVLLSLPQIFGSSKLWPLAFAFQAFASAIGIFILIFSRESPRYLYLTKNYQEASMKSIEFFQGSENVTDGIAELESERLYYASIQQHGSGLRKLFRKTYTKRLLLILALNTACQYSGVMAVTVFSTEMLHKTGLSWEQAKYFTLGVGTVSGLFSLVTLSVDRFGRRKVLLSGYTGIFVSLLVFSICSGLVTISGIDTYWLRFVCGVSLVTFMMSFALQEAVVIFITSELFEQDVRGTAQTIASVIYWIEATVQNFTYPITLVAWGVTYSMIPFLVLIVICSIYLLIALPETKGRSIESISKLFNKNDGAGYGSMGATIVPDIDSDKLS